MKSKELKIYNLPYDTAVLSRINAKPTWLFIFLAVLGALSLLSSIQLVYSITMIIVGVGCAIFMPTVPVIEFYQDYFVMHNRAEKSNCVIVYYNEVKSWHYSWSAKDDFLIVELEDGTIEKTKAFSKTIFELHMYKFLKDKHKKN